MIAGQSDCRVLTAGHKFTLGGHFDANGSYVLTEVKHTANIEGTYAPSPAEFKEAVYVNGFKCIPIAVPFRRGGHARRACEGRRRRWSSARRERRSSRTSMVV